MAGHPYFPPDAVISGYVPNETPLLAILGLFGTIVGSVTLGSVVLARLYSPGMKQADQLTVAWFALCGFLHLFFEGYFVMHYDSIAGSQSLFAQLWKEYALSDSRYLTSDPFILCIESITVITWGPLSFAAALYAARNRPDERGIRHLLQASVSIGHLYGVALYYGTCTFAEHMRGTVFCRPEAVYYWGYYVGMNAPWVVVPAILLWQSARALRGASAAVAKDQEGKKGR